MPQLGRRRRPLHDRCVTPRDPRVTPCDPRMTRLDSDHSLSSSGSDLCPGHPLSAPPPPKSQAFQAEPHTDAAPGHCQRLLSILFESSMCSLNADVGVYLCIYTAINQEHTNFEIKSKWIFGVFMIS